MRWRSCLEQIHERGGSIEIAIAPAGSGDEAGSHLVWRVRVLDLDTSSIVVEQPAALGQSMEFKVDVAFVAIMTVGQNRWRFETRNLGGCEVKQRHGRTTAGLRLKMPESVQRCRRRQHDRVEPAGVSLPHVDLWPLLDPKTVVVAERANEIRLQRGGAPDAAPDDELLPEVGPRFAGLLLNVGGGGIGMLIAPEHNQLISRHKLFWTRIAMPPRLPVPICATAKLVHTHMQSDHHIYAGMAFDFSFNTSHQRIVIEQIAAYVNVQQQDQLEADRAA